MPFRRKPNPRSRSATTISTVATVAASKTVIHEETANMDDVSMDFKPPLISELFPSNQTSWGVSDKGPRKSKPLHKVLRVFAIFDMIRAFWDTITIAIVVIRFNDITREDLSLEGPADVDRPVAAVSYELASLDFEHDKTTFLISASLATAVCVIDIPFTLALIWLTKSRNYKLFNWWTLACCIHIVANKIVFTGILVYCSKSGFLREDIWTGAKGGVRLDVCMYSILFRFAYFDVFKAVELIFTSAFTKEIKEGKKIGVGASTIRMTT